jgi:hypothetical protein
VQYLNKAKEDADDKPAGENKEGEKSAAGAEGKPAAPEGAKPAAGEAAKASAEKK